MDTASKRQYGVLDKKTISGTEGVIPIRGRRTPTYNMDRGGKHATHILFSEDYTFETVEEMNETDKVGQNDTLQGANKNGRV